MTIIDAIKIAPKAIWSYLVATYNSMSDNLSKSNEVISFDIIYSHITKCKDCPARRNETCRACGCNCFVKCELSEECPLWNTEYASEICSTDNIINLSSDTVSITFDLHKAPIGSYHTKENIMMLNKDDRIFKHPFILYKDSGVYKRLILEY